MLFNTKPEFVGIEAIKTRQAVQLAQFERWATAGQWQSIHDHHYDWWMFPIDAPSSYGFAWTVYEGDIAELKKDAAYLDRYLRGVTFLMRAWGWDVDKAEFIPNPQPDQKWQDWPIRLYKAAKSLTLFGYDAQFESLRSYAQHLILSGEDFMYNRRDLATFFE